MTLYMLVTADKYELPLAVRDNVGEIADLIGRLKYDVYHTISKKKVIKVVIDDEEDEDG